VKISEQLTMVIGVIFAIVCFSVAVNGFMSLGELADPRTLADAKGFSFFWAFLGVVAAVFAAVSWWIAKNEKGDRG
jgi:hypothetical protein